MLSHIRRPARCSSRFYVHVQRHDFSLFQIQMNRSVSTFKLSNSHWSSHFPLIFYDRQRLYFLRLRICLSMLSIVNRVKCIQSCKTLHSVHSWLPLTAHEPNCPSLSEFRSMSQLHSIRQDARQASTVHRPFTGAVLFPFPVPILEDQSLSP